MARSKFATFDQEVVTIYDSGALVVLVYRSIFTMVLRRKHFLATKLNDIQHRSYISKDGGRR